MMASTSGITDSFSMSLIIGHNRDQRRSVPKLSHTDDIGTLQHPQPPRDRTPVETEPLHHRVSQLERLFTTLHPVPLPEDQPDDQRSGALAVYRDLERVDRLRFRQAHKAPVMSYLLFKRIFWLAN